MTVTAPGRHRATLTGWGRAHRSSGDVLPLLPGVEPRDAIAQLAGPVIARGCGSSYGDAATNRDATTLDLTRRTRVLSLDLSNGTVTAEAGVTLGSLAHGLLPLGWLPPVLPGTPHVTLGGAVAADVHGKNHRTAGSIGTWVDRIDLDSGIGARPLTPGSEPDLFWATVGGLGLTGVITAVTLRLLPVGPAPARVQRRRARDLDQLLQILDAETDPAVTGPQTHAVAWLDASSRHGRGLVDVVTLAPRHGGWTPPAGSNAWFDTVTPSLHRDRPSLPHGGVVHPAVLRAADRTRWLLPTRADRYRAAIGSLMPLRLAESWPRLFGRDGLVQYQAVVPADAPDVLVELLDAVRRHGLTPALAVLKRLGPADPAPLGFAMDGWTLALDLPASGRSLHRCLAELDDVTAEAGGRVYLAKDLRLPAASAREMYPRLEEWRRVRDAADPRHQFSSDLSRRLRLTV